jgi:hypothetical protein
MEVTPLQKSVRPVRRRGRDWNRRPGVRRRDSFAQEYQRLVDELLDALSDGELEGLATGPRVFFRLDSQGLPEAALVFDPETGRTVQKLRFPVGGEAA